MREAWFRLSSVLGDARTLDSNVDGIERLACGHEQAIPSGAAKADVGANLGQANHTDRVPVRRNDLNTGPRASQMLPSTSQRIPSAPETAPFEPRIVNCT